MELAMSTNVDDLAEDYYSGGNAASQGKCYAVFMRYLER